MAAKMKELGIDRLSSEERVALVQEIWDSVAEDVERQTLNEEERLELGRRLSAHEASPEDVVPWEEVKARALKRAGR